MAAQGSGVVVNGVGASDVGNGGPAAGSASASWALPRPLNTADSATPDHAALSRSPRSGEPTHPYFREKITNCPLVWWALPSPVGSITWPSTAIGLFQWPAGTGSVVITFPLAGW